MFKEFYIDKVSGTYAETLEAFGLAYLVNEVLERSKAPNRKVEIKNEGTYYLVTPSQAITSEMLEKISYFQLIKFLKNKFDTPIPDGVGEGNYYDYPKQKAEFDAIKDARKKISEDKKIKPEERKSKLQAITKQYNDEFGKKLDESFDVYKNMISNPYAGFVKIHSNFHNNQAFFKQILIEIFSFYAQMPNGVSGEIIKYRIKKKDEKRLTAQIGEKLTAQQLYAPNQGKGLNKNKADNANMTNLDGFWVQETMKIAGALQMMICQYVKVGTGYDLKIFVPDFKQILYSKASEVMLEFKRNLKSASPVKVDILNVLNFTTTYIKRSSEYNGKIKNTINGLHSVYQKDLGQNKAVANIAFLELPNFVNINDERQGGEWIEIIDSQKLIIKSIEEQGDAIQGLLAYRNFLCGGDLQSFFKFCNWYSIYLMQALDKEKYYVKPFKIETLNIFYTNMDKENKLNLTEIITNEGFLAVAGAIRKSTVSLQYTPKDQRKFEIRYGLAQEIQNKSKSSLDFATYMGDFIGLYNAETGRCTENLKKTNPNAFAPRAIVRDEELNQFYALLDQNPSRLIGALLTSYGFALKAKEVPDENTEDSNTE
jgi:hypothetical protein